MGRQGHPVPLAAATALSVAWRCADQPARTDGDDRPVGGSLRTERELSHLHYAGGTRSKTDHWKTGFYRLALQVGAPVGLAFIDYGNKRVGVDRWITPSGNESADLQLFRDYYADKTALYPEKAGDIRFKER